MIVMPSRGQNWPLVALNDSNRVNLRRSIVIGTARQSLIESQITRAAAARPRIKAIRYMTA